MTEQEIACLIRSAVRPFEGVRLDEHAIASLRATVAGVLQELLRSGRTTRIPTFDIMPDTDGSVTIRFGREEE